MQLVPNHAILQRVHRGGLTDCGLTVHADSNNLLLKRIVVIQEFLVLTLSNILLHLTKHQSLRLFPTPFDELCLGEVSPLFCSSQHLFLIFELELPIVELLFDFSSHLLLLLPHLVYQVVLHRQHLLLLLLQSIIELGQLRCWKVPKLALQFASVEF